MKIRRLADLRLDELKAALAEVCADWLMVPQRSFTARANGQLDSRCSGGAENAGPENAGPNCRA